MCISGGLSYIFLIQYNIGILFNGLKTKIKIKHPCELCLLCLELSRVVRNMILLNFMWKYKSIKYWFHCWSLEGTGTKEKR